MNSPENPEPKLEFNTLFAEFVAMNRANGVDPSLAEPEGPVSYVHLDMVPARDDPAVIHAQPLSRAEIDRQFRDLQL